MNATIYVKLLHPDAECPQFATSGSAGADVRAVEDEKLLPGEVKLIPLGFAVSIPHGSEIQIRPRSGLAIKHSVTVLNSPGTIDSDYRGEVKVILINHGTKLFDVRKGDRVAQLVVHKLPGCIYREVEELQETARGSDGFGSTGRN